jgi:hypothetical protein
MTARLHQAIEQVITMNPVGALPLLDAWGTTSMGIIAND